MKAVFLTLAVLVASVTAWPQAKNTAVDQKLERILDEILAILIEELSQLIKDRGLDPYYLESGEASYVLPDADFFSASGSVENVALAGLSNIVINHVSYNLATGGLLVDIVFPKVSGSVGAAAGEVKFFTRTISGEGSGSLDLNGVRLHGGAIVQLGTSGVSVNQIQIVLSVEGIESNINLNLFGRDLSDYINNFLGNTLPVALETYQPQITGVLGLIAERLIDRLL